MAGKRTNASEFLPRLTETLRRGLIDHGISEVHAQIGIDTAIRGMITDCYGAVYLSPKTPINPLNFTAHKPAITPTLIKLIPFDDSTSGGFYNALFDCLYDGLTKVGIDDKQAASLTDTAIIAAIETHGGDNIRFSINTPAAIQYMRQQLTGNAL